MAALVVTPPDPLVSLYDAKEHLRVRHYEEDGLIELYLKAATSWIDGPKGWLGRSIGQQVLEVKGTAFGEICTLPFGPVIELVSATYIDEAGAAQTLPADVYELHDDTLALAPDQSWPATRGRRGDAVVRYKAGYPAVPEAVQQAVLLLVGQWYRNRMAINVGNFVNELPFGVEALLAPYRKFG